MPVKIFTDSGSDFSRDEAAKLGIEIIPVYIVYGDQRLRDGVDIDIPTFNLRREAGEHATTDPASVDDYKAAFSKAVEAGSDVVMISLSSAISKSCERARTAAAEFPGRVFVFDSKGASGLESLFAQLAVECANAGDSAEAIAKRLASTKYAIYFAVPDMSALGRGGRIPKAVIALGSMLNVSLVLKMNDKGEVTPAAQSFAFEKTCDIMVEAIVRAVEHSPRARFAIAHVESPGVAKNLSRLLETKLGHPPVQETVRESALTIATHLGKGAVGIYAIVP